MKTLFFFFVILLLLNNINIKEPFENPDEKIFKSCGNNYESAHDAAAEYCI